MDLPVPPQPPAPPMPGLLGGPDGGFHPPMPGPPTPPAPPAPPAQPEYPYGYVFVGGDSTGPRHVRSRPDIRAAMLLLLQERPLSGYQIIHELERRSHGMWRPSPGSVYPVLQQLEDKGLVRVTGAKGTQLFHLTDEGTSYVDEQRAHLGTPWDDWKADADESRLKLRSQFSQLGVAVQQVAAIGQEAQVEQASRLLAGTRRDLYLMLAETD